MDAAPTGPPATSRKRSIRSKVNNQRNKILSQLEAGKTQSQIAQSLGVHRSSISRWLDTLDQEKQELSRFRSNRTDALSQIQSKALTLQAKVLDSLMEGLPVDATLSQKAGLMQSLNIVIGTSYDKERLETGQSTSNHSIVSKMIDSAVQGMYKPLKDKGTVVPAPQEGAGSSESTDSGTTYGDGKQEQDSCPNSEAGGPGGQGEI